jgi:sulfite exporter TauE/SafE
VGFATIATTGAVHAAFGAALLSGSPATGAAIGLSFGLVRSAMLLSAAGVRRPDQLLAVDARLRSWDRPTRGLAVVLEIGALAAGVVALA